MTAHRPVELHTPDSADASRELIQGLAKQGVERVIAFGGDGMSHLAANALVGSDTIMGIVSGGTGNDAATGLGLPAKLGPACEAALAPARSIDMIESVAGVAFTVAIVGFAAEVNARAETMSFPKGGAKYTVATLAELPRLKTYPLTITIDGVAHDASPNLLAIANLPFFGGGMKIAPDADPNDGMLDIVVMGPAPRLAFAALLPTVFSGRHVRSRHVTQYRGREIRIQGAAASIRSDGELWGALPTTFRARPDAIKIAGI